MSIAVQPSGMTPLPPELKRFVTDVLVARLGAKAPDRMTIDLLWGIVESATWGYRESVAGKTAVDVADVTERAVRLVEQFEAIGIDDRLSGEIIDCLAGIPVCAGFFGIARDQSLIPAAAG